VKVSHISKIELVIKDLEALKTACKRMGFEFREGQTTYQWYGRWVGDSPMPEGVTEEELGKCNHAIHVPGAKFEIGIVRKGNAYILLYDSWIKGGLTKHIGKDAGKLKQIYAVEKIRLEARKKGMKVLESIKPKSIRMTLSV
jgi:hypothetical protein